MTLLSSFAPFCSLKLILILWFLHHVNLGVELLTLGPNQTTLLSLFAPFLSLKLILILWFLHHVIWVLSC